MASRDKALAAARRRAQDLMDRGDFARAADEWTTVLKLDPEDLSAYVGRSDCHLELGDRDAAFRDLQQAQVVDPEDPAPCLALATFQAEGGDLKAAEQSFSAALKLAPGMPIALMGRGRVRIMAGDARGGETDLSAALEHADADVAPEALRGRSLARLHLREFDAAADDADDAAEREPDSAEGRVLQALARFGQDDLPGARAALIAAGTHDETVGAQPLLAFADWPHPATEEEAERLERFAMMFTGQDGPLPETMAKAAARLALRDAEGADRALAAAVAAHPEQPLVHLARAQMLAAEERLDEALAVLDAGIERHPQDVCLLQLRGETLMDADDFEGARDSFSAVLALAPLDAEALTDRGYCGLELDDPAAALRDADAALKVAGANPDARTRRLRALALLDAGDPAAALKDINEAAKLEPDDAMNFHARSEIHEALGNDRAAEQDRRRAEALEPDDED